MLCSQQLKNPCKKLTKRGKNKIRKKSDTSIYMKLAEKLYISFLIDSGLQRKDQTRENDDHYDAFQFKRCEFQVECLIIHDILQTLEDSTHPQTHLMTYLRISQCLLRYLVHQVRGLDLKQFINRKLKDIN
ncbi:Hypothetical_protein [Hexamita inflata]|uniref:Hypothetical_protein n=1 Tax=Hexamita inflata TaxID=28002 RepID=A0ABP1IKX9_9EUKA